jgi:hypothetical protein
MSFIQLQSNWCQKDASRKSTEVSLICLFAAQIFKPCPRNLVFQHHDTTTQPTLFFCCASFSFFFLFSRAVKMGPQTYAEIVQGARRAPPPRAAPPPPRAPPLPVLPPSTSSSRVVEVATEQPSPSPLPEPAPTPTEMGSPSRSYASALRGTRREYLCESPDRDL